ncbi:MAG TPA: GNAT family N-acyltransferase [Agitococcus sp.]|nr:GNAT family N-acyltransferase [Agitococcus sp.]
MMTMSAQTIYNETAFVIKNSQGAINKQPKFVAKFASNQQQILAAQVLRSQTFGQEYGVSFAQGIDQDIYDEYCLHLNVYDNNTGAIIATTRLLTDDNAQLLQGFYSEQEFDLSLLLSQLNGRILEIGRTCVHPDYRSGAAITVLWSALAEYLLAENFNYLIGCASIPLGQQAVPVTQIIASLDEENFLADELAIIAKRSLPVQTNVNSVMTHSKLSLPPLLKAYLRMNAKLASQVYYDQDFNCADVFIILDVAHLAGRYAQRFLKLA